MRIIVKPLGMVFMAAVLGGSIFPFTRGNSHASRLPAGVNLVKADNWKFYTEGVGDGTLETTQATPAGSALDGFKISTTKLGAKPWNVGVSNRLKTAFRQGENLNLTFWARADRQTTLGIALQRNTPGFPDCFHVTSQVGPQWKQYHYRVTTFPMADFESMIGMHFGYHTGTVEVVGMQLSR